MRIPSPSASVRAGLALSFSILPGALAWGAAGHEIVATIAQIHLHPAVLPVLCDVLYPSALRGESNDTLDSAAYPPCHLASIASWADRVRGTPAYRHTAAMHYVGALDDLPPSSCQFPGAEGWVGKRDVNVLAAVSNMTGVFAEFLGAETHGQTSVQEGEEALKFLVHFVGDMHQPLHLTGRERGGNGARVAFDDRVSNLHSVWDNILIAQSLRTISSNYTRPLAGAPGVEAHLRGAIYDPYVRRIMHEGFGVGHGGTSGAGRFSAIEEWLACPAADHPSSNDERVDPAPAPRYTDSLVWRVLMSFVRLFQQIFGLDVANADALSLASLLRAVSNSPAGDERRWDDSVLCPYAWASSLHELLCSVPIWPAELDALAAEAAAGRRHPELLELDTPAYAGAIHEQWIVERLLAMAGIRLAGILNGVVLGGEGESIAVWRPALGSQEVEGRDSQGLYH